MVETTNTIPGGKKQESFIERCKRDIVDHLDAGTSILQQDREGIKFPFNHLTKTVYSGLNAIQLAQVIADKRLIIPEFMTQRQISEKGFSVKEGRKGTAVQFYHNQLLHDFDKYPEKKGPDGKVMRDAETGKIIYDTAQEPIHRKGDPVTDQNGKPVGGNAVEFVFDVMAIDMRPRSFRKTGEIKTNGKPAYELILGEQTVKFDKNAIYSNPYLNAKPGDYYKAADNSPVEKYLEATSKYINSIYTGEPFKKVDFTQKEITSLRAEVTNQKSRMLPGLNEAFFLATGQQQKNQEVLERRNQKEQSQTQDSLEREAVNRGGRK